MTNEEFMLAVLDVFAFNYTDELWWRTDAPDYDPIKFFVNCSDVFYWATADLEEITPEDLPLLRQCKADAPTVFATLYAARKRGMRPQGAMYKHFSDKERVLFDACGPAREVDMSPFGNPVAHP